ncbi:hypothetical protein [Methanosarcina sp.]|uniref:hypothetical protein n=1 Tax=Methanosarcina sp. TaxID=2213 RepID=UPI003BB7D4E1
MDLGEEVKKTGRGIGRGSEIKTLFVGNEMEVVEAINDGLDVVGRVEVNGFRYESVVLRVLELSEGFLDV